MRTYGGYQNIREDVTRCVERVAEGGRSVASYQCRRDRGFGKDGLYCKQHAKEYPATNNDVMIWYQINYRDKVESICVTSETESQIYVQHLEGGKSSRQAKTGCEFRTEKEAYEYLLACQIKECQDLENAVKNTKDAVEQTKAKLKEL